MHEIAQGLKANKLQSHVSSDETTRLLRDLTSRMGLFFASGTAQTMRQRDPDRWRQWVKPLVLRGQPTAGGAEGTVRVATADLEALVEADRLVLLQLPRDGTLDPYGQKGDGSNYRGGPPVLSMPSAIRVALRRYLRRVLTNELAVAADLTIRGKRLVTARYRAIVSVDYYSSRPLNSNNLHKDTAGCTLFVALHYVNRDRMLGPEYVNDRWRMGSDHNSLFPAAPGQAKRYKAPWTRTKEGVTGEYFWPKQLIEHLETARRSINKQPDDTLQYETLAPYGLVSFVDELVYHATPFEKNRREVASSRKLFESVMLETQEKDLFPAAPNGGHRLERAMSTDLDARKAMPTQTGGEATRCFLRLWMSVVPKEWYKLVR